MQIRLSAGDDAIFPSTVSATGAGPLSAVYLLPAAADTRSKVIHLTAEDASIGALVLFRRRRL